MKPILLDTDPVVALLDAADPSHAWVRDSFGKLPPDRPFLTTAAVITEIMFHLQDCVAGPQRICAFIDDAHIRIEDAFASPHLHGAAELMEKYADVPMDFADATLVLLAARFETADMVTLDERGFREHRFLRNRSFRLLLQD